jgi:ribonucleoside-diphosphate reductase alpha subunit
MRRSPKISPQRRNVAFSATSNSRYGPPPSGLKDSHDPSVVACGRVRKRNGNYEEISIAKIERRLKTMSRGLHVDPISLSRQVLNSVHDGISVRELDILAAGFAHEKITDHPDYDVLAARLAVSNHHKETMAPFSEVMRALHAAGQIRDDFMALIEANSEKIDSAIDYDRDNLFTYFGFRTFEHSYSLTIVETDAVSGKEVNRCYERPQHMYMRTALELHMDDIEAAIETYNWMSCQYFIHATPTLMNAGKKKAQMSSCFLVAMDEDQNEEHPDSIRGIYKTLSNIALISASSGGIGMHCSIVRAEGSPIQSAGRPSSGIIPMLQPFEATANYVDQGRKRKGAIAVYLEPHHADIENFIKIKDNNVESQEWKESGKTRLRDLHIALWISDIFMQRVDEDGPWSLMCPFYSPDLVNLYGEAYTKRYQEYEQMGWPYVRKTIRARQLWTSIIDAQIHTGEPYMCYKDSVNRKTNHQNLGTIRSSNLCSEIMQYSDSTKTSTCNLASISLKIFVLVDETTGIITYDHDTLAYVTKIVTRNLDRVIDQNHYPVQESKNSNMSERPMGIGVQGLADAYIAMRYPYDSPEAANLNREIFETIYYAALDASCELAEEYGAPYPSYAGSPVSQGRLQFDMWKEEGREVILSGRWDWNALRTRIAKHGVRNSLLVALMPTASTSQLLGNNECLTGDSLVSTADGLAIPIESIIDNTPVYGVDSTGLQPDYCMKLIDQGEKDVVELTFSDGRLIKCTPNHRFLLKTNVWKEASQIVIGQDEICIGVDPIIDISDFDTWSWCGKDWKRPQALALARIIGFVHADGTVSSTPYGFEASAILGCAFDVQTLLRDIELLGETAHVSRQWNNTYRIRFHSNLTRIIEKAIGHGKRVDKPFELPDFLFGSNTPLSVIREYLAGHFGGDGHRPHLAGSSLRGVQLSHHIRDELADSLLGGLDHIKHLLHKLGVHGNHRIIIRKLNLSNGFSTREDTTEIRLALDANSSFSSCIGFRYCIDKSMKLSIASSYWRYVETSMRQRDNVVDCAKDFMSNKNLSVAKALEAAREITFDEVDLAPLSDYAYGSIDAIRYQRTQRRGKTGVSPKEYVERFDAWNQKYCVAQESIVAPTFHLTVINRREIGKAHVFDISVKNTHAFFANGIAVHNCFEPFTDNMYIRNVLSGSFKVVNRQMIMDLIECGLWSDQLKNKIISAGGSIQEIDEIPPTIRALYKTAYDIRQRVMLDQAADRGPFIDQSCSQNCHMAQPTLASVTSYHMYGWKKGLKTGLYYLRSKPAKEAVKVTVDPTLEREVEKAKVVEDKSGNPPPTVPDGWVCRKEEGCITCSS